MQENSVVKHVPLFDWGLQVSPTNCEEKALTEEKDEHGEDEEKPRFVPELYLLSLKLL